MRYRRFVVLLSLVGAASVAEAHTGLHAVAGWAAGFAHPWSGVDHLLAMLGVGLWAAFVTPAPAQVWRLPAAFVAVMALGGVLGASGLGLASAEFGIAASVLLLGLLVALKLRLSSPLAALLVGLFALFHGIAHGAEMGQGADFFAYALGFVCATALLHGAGLVLGRGLLPVAAAYRASGLAISGMGLLLLLHAA
jgi:urease accessory protein